MVDKPSLVTHTSSTDKTASNQQYGQLLESYQLLEDRYTALFKINQFSNDCADLSSFFQQVHSVIASLMHAKNFYICMYDQTFSTLEFVYHVDENDESPQGVFDYQEFDGSLTQIGRAHV